MLHVRLLAAIIVFGGSFAWAQDEDDAAPTTQIAPGPGGEITARAVHTDIPLRGPWKLQYVVRTVGLNADQQVKAKELLDSMATEIGDIPEDIKIQIAQLQDQMRKAARQKKTKQVREIQKKIIEITPDPEGDYFRALREELDEAQRERLAAARARLLRNDSGALRPVDIFNEASALDLSDEQRHTLGEIKDAARTAFSGVGATFDMHRRARMMNRFNQQIRAILNETQRTDYDDRLFVLRPDTLPGIAQMDALVIQGKTKAAPSERQGQTRQKRTTKEETETETNPD